MERVREGDEAAFTALMARWERPIKVVIARLIGNVREAEDLAEETFVHVWQQRSKFRPGALFRPWILTLALNLARNRLRWWRRRPAISWSEWDECAEAPAPAGSSHDLGDATSGAAPLEQRERAAAVRAAVAALPAEWREVIVLAEYESHSHQEIADLLHTTPKAVESRLARARHHLRHALRNWW